MKLAVCVRAAFAISALAGLAMVSGVEAKRPRMDIGQNVDAAARSAMERTGARGLAVAVVDGGKVSAVRTYGARNAAGAPLEPDTIMYGASITKAAFAYMVMQLAGEGRIDLDRPIGEYLEKPLPDYGNLEPYGNWGDLAGDNRWRKLTARILLTHSAGFANFFFLEPDQKLKFHFEPGSRYAYSGEGIILLQFVLEKGLGIEVGAEMKRRVFDPLGMANTSMTWRPDFARNLADGWTEDGSVETHDQRERVRAAGSMDTSIADLARFAAALVRGEGLSRSSRAEMVRPQLPITTASQFPTLLPEAPPEKRWKDLAAGIGLVTFKGRQGRGFFKGGHNDSTANMLVCLERKERCVLILSNDVRSEKEFPAMVESILGPTGLPWKWEYSG